MTQERCHHWNRQGFGRCVLVHGHPPRYHSDGVSYAHQYSRRGQLGVFAASEVAEPGRIMDPCSSCGQTQTVFWEGARWTCVSCYASGVLS
jgi:hypothetical protein